jgi:hypothetical protein
MVGRLAIAHEGDGSLGTMLFDASLHSKSYDDGIILPRKLTNSPEESSKRALTSSMLPNRWRNPNHGRLLQVSPKW